MVKLFLFEKMWYFAMFCLELGTLMILFKYLTGKILQLINNTNAT